MSAEFMAEKVLDVLTDGMPSDDYDSDQMADENVRSGGYWFTCTYRGKHYEIEVTEVTQR